MKDFSRNNFLLILFDNFLSVLSIDKNFSLTIKDYDRIALILNSQNEWTLSQLRGVFVALLTHTPEESEIFRRRFDNYFQNFEISEKIRREEIRQFISDLKESGKQLKQFDLEERDGKILVDTEAEKELTKDNEPNVKKRTSDTFETTKSDQKKSAIIYFINKYRNLILIGILSLLLLTGIIFGLFDLYDSYLRTTEVKDRVLPVNSFNSNTAINKIGINTQPINPVPTRTISTPTPSHSPTPSPTNTPKYNPLQSDNWIFYGLFFLLIVGVPAFAVLIPTWFPNLLLKLLELLDFINENDKFEKKETYDYSQKPQFFRLSQIGGKPLPLLDEEILDEMSKSFDYISYNKASKKLDLRKSIKASALNAGIFTLNYQNKKEIFTIYILEDQYADQLIWNSSATELYEGLHKRGLDVRYGKFFNTLDFFQIIDGETLRFEDLENLKENSLFLFFSDGNRLNPMFDSNRLDSIAELSSVAWLDLREEIFWDESARLIKRHKIPHFQASREGIINAVRFLATGNKSKKTINTNNNYLRYTTTKEGLDFTENTKKLLGDNVMLWMQACSMIQPVTLGMADSLRRTFAPLIPPDQIERLFRLPKTTWDVAGISFSLPVLSILHRSFNKNRTKEEQEKILNFILNKVEKAEPKEPDSLEYMTWQWVYEKVRLELDPDKALHSFEKLVKTPLANQIKSDFSKLSLPDESLVDSDEDSVKIELRLTPKIPGLLTFQELTKQKFNFKKLNLWKRLKLFLYRIFSTIKPLVTNPSEAPQQILKLYKSFIEYRNERNSFDNISHTARFIKTSYNSESKLLEVRNLNTQIQDQDYIIKAVDNVDLMISPGEVVGLVGESGCGKSTLLLSIIGLIKSPSEIVSGEILFKGKDLLKADEEWLKEVRGKQVSVIFQNPVSSLNPYLTVGEQIAEVYRLHLGYNAKRAYAAAIEAMEAMSIPDAGKRANDYPHQFSGGMCQRIMIAMSLFCYPELLLADEPTSALDIITQAQILELLKQLKRDSNTAILFVTHDLSLLAGFADKICVMYGGQIVEVSNADQLFKDPKHPYTMGLIKSIPNMQPETEYGKPELQVLEGDAYDFKSSSKGCKFALRCQFRMESCGRGEIPMVKLKNGTEVRCLLYN